MPMPTPSRVKLLVPDTEVPLAPLCLTVRKPVLGPGGYGPVGAKLTPSAQLAPVASVNGAAGQAPEVAVASLNSDDVVTELTVSAMLPLFEMLTVAGLLTALIN